MCLHLQQEYTNDFGEWDEDQNGQTGCAVGAAISGRWRSPAGIQVPVRAGTQLRVGSGWDRFYESAVFQLDGK